MVEVFKTNVCEEVQASRLTALLKRQFPGSRVSFDLEDSDNVLRVEGDITPIQILQVLHSEGCLCEALE